MKSNSHYNSQAYPKCGRISVNKNISLDYSIFLNRAVVIHNNRYTYQEESYINYTSKIKMYCDEHSFFE
ncbi:MAG: hypothetical protein ACI9L6_001328 [Flavobacterium sp.]|jgi:hypothetical protein